MPDINTRAELRRHLQRWKGACAVCVGQGTKDGERHELWQCTRETSRDVKEIWKVFRGREGIKYDKGSACKKCGVPREMCIHWQEYGRGNCDFDSVMTQAFVGILYGFKGTTAVTSWRTRVYSRGLISYGEEETGEIALRGGNKMVDWLGKGHEWAGFQTHHLAEEVCILSRGVERRM